MLGLKKRLKDLLINWLFEKKFTSTDGVSFNKLLYGKILPRIEAYNKIKPSLRNLLCEEHNENYVRFLVSEIGVKKIIWGKKQKDAEKFGLGVGFTFSWLMSERASSKEILKTMEKAIARDETLQKCLILDTCLKSSTYGFFNGKFDTLEKRDRPPIFKNQKFTPDHSHYIALGKDKFYLEDLTLGKKDISEHFAKQKNFISFLNSDTAKKINNFRKIKNASCTLLKNTSNEITLPNFIGTSQDAEIMFFEDEWMPDDYLLLLALSPEKILSFIEKKNPSAKGLFFHPGGWDSKTYLINSDFLHWCSVFVLERAAGVVLYLGKEWKDPEMIANIAE